MPQVPSGSPIEPVEAAPPVHEEEQRTAGEGEPRRTGTPYRPRSRRKVLCIFPRYTHSFGTFDHAFPLMRVRAFMPPQGILAVTAYLPREWEARFIDENVRPASDDDFRWADAVFLSGMHVQREHILALNERAHSFGKVTVLGGPSVSGCSEWYPGIDLLHLGELGDATDAIIERLDRSVERPESQETFATVERVPLSEFPVPAYRLLDLRDYFLASVQFSSGCPYLCEFCDIPALYGRNPRLKSPRQVTAELDAMLERGNPGSVYFVDDNFIGNQKAALALLEELARWQEERGYPIQFACEATLNLARAREALSLMREANFTTVFCGIESPDEEALEFMQKKQNLRQPILEAIRVINSYGIEIVSGIILGLDTDTPRTGEQVSRFIEASGIPMLTINILHALPRTPLWDRLLAQGRLVDGAGRESNVEFLLPHQTVVEMWRQCIARAYSPEALYARYAIQSRETYPRRKALPPSRARLNWKNLRRGLGILCRLLWRVGARSDYRGLFWRMALPALLRGKIEEVIHIGVVGHHLILFARECARGEGEKCFYGAAREAQSPPAVVV